MVGEGAGGLVLERLDFALERGATPLAEVIGYGNSADAYHVSAPEPEGKGAARSMKRAMAEAGIGPSDIDYINAHGTSTQLNDDAARRRRSSAPSARTPTAIRSARRSR